MVEMTPTTQFHNVIGCRIIAEYTQKPSGAPSTMAFTCSKLPEAFDGNHVIQIMRET